MRRRLRAWGSGLLVAGLSAGFLGGGTAMALGGGDEVPDGGLPFVAQVTFGDSRGCTGALVDARWIVTAKACFADGTSEVAAGAPAKPTTVVLGRADLTRTTGHRLAVVSLVPHAGRNIVLAELSAPVRDIAPVALDGGAPVRGETLRVAGYGRTGTAWVPDRLHAAAFTVDTVSADAFAVQGASAGAVLCRGDAGGPAFRETPAGPQLVGISDTSGQKGCFGEPPTRTADASEARTDDLADWIRASTAVLPDALREPVTGEFNRDGRQDLIAADAAGALWLYPGTATRNVWGHRVRIGSGWSGYREFAVGRIDRDEYDDLVTIETATNILWMYPGTAAGGKFGTRVQIGSGWTTDFRDIAIGKVNRDQYDDLLVVHSPTQRLMLYKGNAAGGNFDAGVQYGTGWACCKELQLGRFNDDDYDDLQTVDSTGKMRIYAGTAAGDQFTPAVDAGAGTDWANRSGLFPIVVGAENRSGLLARDASGALVHYTVQDGRRVGWSDPVAYGPRD